MSRLAMTNENMIAWGMCFLPTVDSSEAVLMAS